MLYTEILNHMETDELRNYVCHLKKKYDEFIPRPVCCMEAKDE